MPNLVIGERRRDLGNFEVGRVLPFAKRRMVGPFVFFDHMLPVQMPVGVSRSADVRPHPHIGETGRECCERTDGTEEEFGAHEELPSQWGDVLRHDFAPAPAICHDARRREEQAYGGDVTGLIGGPRPPPIA